LLLSATMEENVGLSRSGSPGAHGRPPPWPGPKHKANMPQSDNSDTSQSKEP
jgi:hypothetical protein